LDYSTSVALIDVIFAMNGLKDRQRKGCGRILENMVLVKGNYSVAFFASSFSEGIRRNPNRHAASTVAMMEALSMTVDYEISAGDDLKMHLTRS
jgi:hypothetical protein